MTITPMQRILLISAAAEMLAAEEARPVRAVLSHETRSELRRIINQPTAKRAKIKTARKQRTRK